MDRYRSILLGTLTVHPVEKNNVTDVYLQNICTVLSEISRFWNRTVGFPEPVYVLDYAKIELKMNYFRKLAGKFQRNIRALNLLNDIVLKQPAV